jgi:uncharacterized OB-fold protein
MPADVQSPLEVYFDHLERGELAYQFSRAAGRPVFFPRVLCPFTGSDQLEWRVSAGIGTVHATTVVHQSGVREGSSTSVPYDVSAYPLAAPFKADICVSNRQHWQDDPYDQL